MSKKDRKKTKFSYSEVWGILGLGLIIVLVVLGVSNERVAEKYSTIYDSVIKYLAANDFVGVVFDAFKLAGYGVLVSIFYLMVKSFFDKSSKVFKKVEKILIKLEMYTIKTFKSLVELLGEIPEFVRSIQRIMFGKKSDKPLARVLSAMVVCISIISLLGTYEKQVDTDIFNVQMLIDGFISDKDILEDEIDLFSFLNHIKTNEALYTYETLLEEVSKELTEEIGIQYKIDELIEKKATLNESIIALDVKVLETYYGFSLEPQEEKLLNNYLALANNYRDDLIGVENELDALNIVKSHRMNNP